VETVAIDVFTTYGIFGIFGILFVILLIYVLNTNSKREDKMMKCMDEWTKRLPGIADDLREMKGKMEEHDKMVTGKLTSICDAVRSRQ